MTRDRDLGDASGPSGRFRLRRGRAAARDAFRLGTALAAWCPHGRRRRPRCTLACQLGVAFRTLGASLLALSVLLRPSRARVYARSRDGEVHGVVLTDRSEWVGPAIGFVPVVGLILLVVWRLTSVPSSVVVLLGACLLLVNVGVVWSISTAQQRGAALWGSALLAPGAQDELLEVLRDDLGAVTISLVPRTRAVRQVLASAGAEPDPVAASEERLTIELDAGVPRRRHP
jgi:hypothetical protein